MEGGSSAKGDIFEINDFTNATAWEIFIADIEEVLRQWGLAAQIDDPILDPLRRQHRKSEHLTYAGRRFLMKLEVSGESASSAHQPDERRKEAWTSAMFEMMDSRGDFPPRSHPISRWYGVREFVLITPEKGVESLTSQAQVKLMLSTVSIAIANTQCTTPIFIQTHQQWRHLYVGVALGLGGAILVNFTMIHLKHTPLHLTHLSGLLDMFKAKIKVASRKLDPVHIAVRYTYTLKHWSLEDWPVEPLEDIEGDEETVHWKDLPVGPLSDPINELHLSAVWPNLSEETVIDHDSHIGLHPTHAPLWTVSAHLQDSTSCFLSEVLQEFLKLCYREESLDQLLRTSNSEDSLGSTPRHQPYSQALSKLTNQSVSSLGSPFLTSVVYSASQRLEFGLRGKGGTNLSDKKMKCVLKVLFPDVYKLPVPPGQENRIKSAPQGSLSRQIASTLSIVNNDCGLRAFAEVWNEIVQELRYRWDRALEINSLPEGLPDMASCLLHQKLQMLNCCIRHKKSHEEKLYTPNIKKTQSSHSFSKSRTSRTPSSSDSDEFYEALEIQDSEMPDSAEAMVSSCDTADSGSEQLQDRVGALRQCADLVLVATGEPLYIPVTQDHTPMTEDMIQEQQEVLANLGTSEEAAKVRAKMQSSSLLSDMQAFKAANPGSLMEDFVRWYSPRDWMPSGDLSPSLPTSSPASTSEGGVAEGCVAGGPKEEEEEDVGVAVERDDDEGVASDAKGVPVATEEGRGEWSQEGWGQEGDWGQEDWDVVGGDNVISNSAMELEGGVTKRFVRGCLSERMVQPDNVWVETWQSAMPIPAYRQKRIFDDTKEAEKVLHFFSNQKPCELAMAILPMLLHSAVEKLQCRLSKQPLGRAEGLLQDAMSLLATVQQPSLDTLPLYQECISLLSQAERLLAAAHSLREKLHKGLELVYGEGGVATLSPEASAEVAVGSEVMLESPELIIDEPMKSNVGVAMRGLLIAQSALQDSAISPGKFRHPVPPPHTYTQTGEFPLATWREFILRSSTPSPTPHSQLSPQRMFCVLQPGSEFRVAGTFSRDTNLS